MRQHLTKELRDRAEFPKFFDSFKFQLFTIISPNTGWSMGVKNKVCHLLQDRGYFFRRLRFIPTHPVNLSSPYVAIVVLRHSNLSGSCIWRNTHILIRRRVRKSCLRCFPGLTVYGNLCPELRLDNSTEMRRAHTHLKKTYHQRLKILVGKFLFWN